MISHGDWIRHKVTGRLAKVIYADGDENLYGNERWFVLLITPGTRDGLPYEAFV